MAHWDSEKGMIVYRPTKKAKYHPKWDEIDCGCCCGIKWGGEYPDECERCGGSGVIYLHRKSGVTAKWPGGPFI
jgi:hypothetical protein